MNQILRPLIISGPSGAGKTTLIQPLLKKFPKTFTFTCSHTTRKRRPQEIHGVNYYFTTHSKMEQQIQENLFIEHVKFAGNLYGTSHFFIYFYLDYLAVAKSLHSRFLNNWSSRTPCEEGEFSLKSVMTRGRGDYRGRGRGDYSAF